MAVCLLEWKVNEFMTPNLSSGSEGRARHRSKTLFGVDWRESALVIALVPMIASAIRIWMLSGGDKTLFFVLLRGLNIPALLIGTVVSMLPTVLIIGFWVMITDKQARSELNLWANRLPASNHIFIPLLALIVLFTTTLSTALTLAGMAAFFTAVHFIRRGYFKRKARKNSVGTDVRKPSRSPDFLPSFVVVIFMFLLLPSNIWLPAEQLTTSSNGEINGYVLESDITWTTVLTTDRHLVTLATPQILTRSVCADSEPRTLANLYQKGGIKGGPQCK